MSDIRMVVEKPLITEKNTALKDSSNRYVFKVALKARVGRSVRYSHTLHTHMMYVAVPLARDGKILGVVRCSKPLKAVHEVLGAFRAKALATVFSGYQRPELTLEFQPNPDILEVIGRQRCSDEAALPFRQNETIGGQAVERLAQGCGTDTVLLSQ